MRQELIGESCEWLEQDLAGVHEPKRAPQPTVISGLKPLLLLVGVAAAIAAGVGVMLWSVGRPTACCTQSRAAKTPRRSPRRSTAPAFPTSSKAAAPISVPAEQLAAARLQARGAGPARKRRRRECHDQGSGLRRQRVHGERALPARARNRTRPHHRHPAERAGRARAPGHGAAVRVRSDRRPGSASVFLQIKAGRRLDDEQVQAIANLVASSIPEMQASQVTVVDQAGRLLSAPEHRQRHRRCATRCSSSRIASKSPMRSASRRC